MFFHKKKRNSLKAYTDGEIIPITQVNDQVFSQKMMGDGVAIISNVGKVVAPCDGKISLVFKPTNHAIGITLDNKMEILLHIGLDTVNLSESLFTCRVKKDDYVRTGETLVTYDVHALESINFENIVMCVITSEGDAKDIVMNSSNPVKSATDDILFYK